MGVLRLRELNKIKRWQPYKIKSPNKTWEQFENIGAFYLDMKIRLGDKNGKYIGIKDAWKNQPCAIVGASSSLKGYDLKKLKGMHTIGINHMIEYWDGYEWFIFLDNRFLKKTTYDINKFRGKIFCSNRCELLSGFLDSVRFKPKPFRSKPTLNIEEGLFNASLTGLCALNLALITGANPIYMLGMDDSGNENATAYHYDEKYTGEIKTDEKYQKYVRTRKNYKKFEQWKNRIINVCPNGTIDLFKKISLEEFDERLVDIKSKSKIVKKKQHIKVKGREATICHVITMPEMSKMGDISRQVYNYTKGRHISHNINNPNLPKADIYLLECFINGAEKYINFKKPAGSKVVSIVHSSSSCSPAKCSDKVITLTNSWKEIVKRKNGFDSVVIPAGIDITKYKYPIDYTKKTFGRITRWSKGKVHPNWITMAISILESIPDSECYMITKPPQSVRTHNRLNFITDIEINQHIRKAKAMSNFGIYADMHNTFVETFSLCLLEAMAAGQAVVLFSRAPQPSMVEIISNYGFICKSPEEFRKTILELLSNVDKKMEYGKKARFRARQFSVNRMIEEYNKVFTEVLNT
jgi:glycosyltransferase involved in cell wall biosynthesis